MTKSLSQELCELCGVKPEITWTDCSKDCDPCITPCGCNDSIEVEIYPDFENNAENFVKLLELPLTMFEDACLIDYILNIRAYKNKNVFLLNIVDILKDNTRRVEIKDDIKQAIRNTEWKH